MPEVELIRKVAENSILIAILLAGFIYVGKKLLEEKDKRITDAKENTSHVTLTLDKVDDTLKALIIAVGNNKNDNSKNAQ